MRITESRLRQLIKEALRPEPIDTVLKAMGASLSHGTLDPFHYGEVLDWLKERPQLMKYLDSSGVFKQGETIEDIAEYLQGQWEQATPRRHRSPFSGGF